MSNDGWIRTNPNGGRLHWREGDGLLCRRTPDPFVVPISTDMSDAKCLEQSCTNCRAEIKRRTQQAQKTEEAPMTAAKTQPQTEQPPVPSNVHAFEAGDLVTAHFLGQQRGVVEFETTTNGMYSVLISPEGSVVPARIRAEEMEPLPLDLAHDTPFQIGDRVMYWGPDKVLIPNAGWKVTATIEGRYEITGAGGARTEVSHAHLRLLGRADVQEALRVLGFIDQAATPALTSGWWRKGDGPAHWIQDGKALCGRELPAELTITTADPAAPEFQDNQCKKCIKAMDKAGIGLIALKDEAQAAAPDQQDNPFPVSEAELDAKLTPATTYPQTIQVEIPGTPVLGTELASSEPLTADVSETAPAAELPLGRTTLPWNSIVRSDLNPRKVFEEEALKELASSIYTKGLKQNLVVRPHPAQPGKFEIAAGERRWRAIGLLVKGFEQGEGEAGNWLEVPADWPVPVLVEELSDLELLEVATAENVQRRRMTPMEEADAFAALIDHGASVDDVAAKFGFHRRTVIRRVQISKNLIPDIREKFEEGVLTLAQVEVLAAAGPETQKVVWGNIRYNPRSQSPADLRKSLTSWSFLVKHAQFPPTWYTGGVVQDDLFGDVEPYFLDPQQAMECQLKHARHLAEKDVEKGATFADVVLGVSKWRYGEGGTGVVYNINEHTGKLERWENMRPPIYTDVTVEFRAGKVDPEEEAGQKTMPTRPAAAMREQAELNIPRYGQVVTDDLREASLTRLCSDPALTHALYIYGSADYNLTLNPRSQEQKDAVLEFLSEGEGFFELDDDRLIPGNKGSHLRDVLPFLLSQPAERLALVMQVLLLGQVDDVMLEEDWVAFGQQTGQPFTLTAEYLEDCNDRAVVELWDDAEMGSRANTTPEYLRSMLLEEAPALAARGFLPRPLRGDE